MLNPLRLSAAKMLPGLAACFAFLPGAFGQAPGTGAIRGSVAHTATRAYLHGASVRVAGSDLVAFTEQDGTFFLAAVPAGQRHLAIDLLDRPGPVRSGAAAGAAARSGRRSQRLRAAHHARIDQGRIGRSGAVTAPRRWSPRGTVATV